MAITPTAIMGNGSLPRVVKPLSALIPPASDGPDFARLEPGLRLIVIMDAFGA